MAQTVIGVFDNTSEAQQAAAQLERNGFDRDYIDVSSRSETNDTGTATDYQSNKTHDNDSFGDKISDFFRSLFDGNDAADHYSEVARRGSVVTVHTKSLEEAEQAAEILDTCGAIDIDERIESFTNTITTGTSTIGRTSTPSPERSLGNVQDRVTHYGDRLNADRLNTGTLSEQPTGGDLNDRISNFADTNSTINSTNEDESDDLDRIRYLEYTIEDSDATNRGTVADADYTGIEADTLDPTITGEGSVPGIENNPNIAKGEITTGRAGVRSRIVEISVEERLRLRTVSNTKTEDEQTNERLNRPGSL